MGIALVADVKHKPVTAGIKDSVQGNRQLYDTQIGAKVAAGKLNTAYQILPKLSADLLARPGIRMI